MNPISGQVQAVLDLFASALVEVRFADLDAAALSRAASEVNVAAERVAAAQAALDDACAVLKERQNALLLQAQRALAYARVYAETDDALSTLVENISLPRSSRRTRTEDDVLGPSPEPELRPIRRRRSSTRAQAPAADAAAAE